MKNPLLLLLVACFLIAVPSGVFAQNPGTRDVSGSVFRDPNTNGRLDKNEKAVETGTVWLYRVEANGQLTKIRGPLPTNAGGQYNLKNVPFGRYVLAIRYNRTGQSVRTGIFRVGKGTKGLTRNVPFITPQTASKYPGYQQTANPGNLQDGNQGNSPSAP